MRGDGGASRPRVCGHRRALRWPIALLWIAGAVAAVISLPSLSERSAGSLGTASAAIPLVNAAAGLVLACSFALLAIVPLWEFREFAVAMMAGLLVDAFLIRLVLVPSFIALAGRHGAAPANRRVGRR